MTYEPNEQPLSPREMAQLADETERHADRELNPDTRLVYASWGVAYLVGFGALWLADRADPVLPRSAAGVIFALCLGLAGVITGWTNATASRGVGGPEADYAHRWALTFGVSFAGYGLIVVGLGRALDALDAPRGDVMSLIAPVLAVFVVGVNYLNGGSHWRSSLMYPIGLALIAISGIAAIVGVPNHALVLGIGGGGCFLVGALLLGSRTRARSPEGTRTGTALRGTA